MGFLERCSLIRLDQDTPIPDFDCGDADLNDYIRNDAFDYNRKLLAVTNLVFSGSDLVAFYSVSNDKISQQDGFSNRSYDRFRRAKLDRVRTRSFPGVKIGRFAVSTRFKNIGIGRELLDYIKMHFLDNNKTGCRFITVDAYISSIEFYQKNDFVFLTDSDKDDPHTRLMFFDLARLV
jgi:GNAT superfamily N-acetyltransferase